ncbi:energy transducer TonB [Orenia marismortui]|uniref:energy transducer TonB n=1 Tax=Orenia marismortui TaxID=46469 RepID=UPI00036AD97C|nr:energy transducer TonB [Orenia marismortui]
MEGNDNFIRPALLLALVIHCLLIGLAWKFHDDSSTVVEIPTEMSIEFAAAPAPERVGENSPSSTNMEEIVEKPKPISEEVEEVVEKPKPISEEVEEVVEKPKPISEEVEEVVEKPKPVSEEVEEVVEKPKPISEEVEEVVEKPKPISEEVEEVVEKPKPISEEAEEVVEKPKPVSEEVEEAVEKPKPVSEEVEEVVKESESITEQVAEERAQKSRPIANNQKQTTKEVDNSLAQNSVQKQEISESYFQMVLRRIAAAKRYPQYARDQEFEGKALVEFVIRSDGRLEKSRVVNSSGYPSLDHEAIATLKRSAPFPPIPKRSGNNLVTMRVAIVFELK